MKAEKKWFAVYYSPGTFVAEQSERELEGPDPAEAMRHAMSILERYNARPYGFQLEQRVVAGDVDDGFGGKLHVEPRTLSTSGMHYICGTLETLDQVRQRADPKESILLSNMEGNRDPIVVTGNSPWKWTHVFNEIDVVVNSDGVIVERGNDPKHVAYRTEAIARIAAERGY